MKYIKTILILLALSIVSIVQGQEISFDSTKNIKRNVKIVIGSGATLYVGSMTGLYFLWYAGYDQSSFHFFNDNAEWMQTDKAGHAVTSYNVGMYGYDALRLAGVNEKKAALYGGPLGFLYLTTVEVFDGFSDGWGFSWGDIAANTLGTGLFMTQQLLWKEQRISLKYSFHTTNFPQYRPDLFGNNFAEQFLKDYNGSTFWMSFNIKSLFLKSENRFPTWLNISLGYSAKGMTGGFVNATSYNGITIPEFDRTREFLLSPDIDLTRIPVKNKCWKAVFKALSFIKIPMPTLSYESNGNWNFYWLYF